MLFGGEMGKNIDKTFIQSRMLNTSKGPAVHSLRAQADRKKYQMEMKHTLERQENLFLKQAEIVDIKVEDGKVTAIDANVGAIYHVKAVILASGTYLKGKIFIGEFSTESGPDGVAASNKLSDCLKELGKFLDKEKLKLNKETRIYKSTNNFIFLGRKPNGDYAKYRDVKRKIKKRIYLYKTGQIEFSGLLNSIICYNNLCKKGSNY